jgi:hypothetical protein
VGADGHPQNKLNQAQQSFCVAVQEAEVPDPAKSPWEHELQV